MARFSVDTKLFRELGELLVGRESTALVELIKNSYDADATRVRLHGEQLNNPKTGIILVEDNGTGMDELAFRKGFLTIAGRTKLSTEKRSQLHNRRFTGEKGVGRLSAHKLGAKLDIVSSKWNGIKPDTGEALAADEIMHASIDWDSIEKKETFEDIDEGDVQMNSGPKKGRAGTKLTLSRIRKKWTKRTFRSFFDDVATLVPNQALLEKLEPHVEGSDLLFARPNVTSFDNAGGAFDIEYSGDFKRGDFQIPSVREATYWVIEIRCDAKARRVDISVSPTSTALRDKKFETAEAWSGTFEIPQKIECVSFDARIFEKEGKAWPNSISGVRVYLEGFRVPPYGDPSNDWLELDRDYRARGGGYQPRLRAFSEWRAPEGDKAEGTDVKGNPNYFGAVFLTREGASELRMLVNREGFVPGAHWEGVTDIVRWAIGVQVRQRTMARLAVRERPTAPQVVKRRDAVSHGADDQAPSVFEARRSQALAAEVVAEIKTAISAGRSEEANTKLQQLGNHLRETDRLIGDHASEATMYRVLAAVGLEQAAFVHEILGLGISASAIATALKRAAQDVTSPDMQKRLRRLIVETTDLQERLNRNGVYLTQMTGIEGRKRRSRLKFRDRFEPVEQFFAAAASKRDIEIINDLPPNLLSPPMFPAEISALFSNLLSNAIKFADRGGKVRVVGDRIDGEVIVRIENTGEPVDLEHAQRWFEPFKTTTGQADPTLGQGMGLGLTVSRSLMDEYGGTIFFVAPSASFSTAVEVRWLTR